MPLIGNAIKAFIELANEWKVNQEAPIQRQRRELRKLLEKAKNTAFGKYYGFEDLLNAEDPLNAFQQAVPVFEYDAMYEQWWQQQEELPDITWVGMPDYFALTSGTTSDKIKRIPVTADMLRSFRSVGLQQIKSLANFNLPADLFEKDLLMLSSSADLKENQGRLEGEISGINVSNLPFWTDSFYKPGHDIAAIDNWDERIHRIVEEANNWDVGAIAGIPSWILLMIKAILERYQLSTIHDIWPNLQVFASGGAAFSPYRKAFDRVTARPLIIMDTYLASEGFFAYNARPETRAMRLALENGFFLEFIPFDERGFDEQGNLLPNPLTLSIDQVVEKQDYAMLASTSAGAWRYMIGDTIRFTSLEESEMVITGRTKYFLNVAGAQLSEPNLNQAIRMLAEELGVIINEFSVAALEDDNGGYFHQWVLGMEETVEENKAAERLDAILQEKNKAYQSGRAKGAIPCPRVFQARNDRLYHWLEVRKKMGGQVKFPKVLPASRMEDLLLFLEKAPGG